MRTGTRNTTIESFDSVNAFVTAINTRPQTARGKMNNSSRCTEESWNSKCTTGSYEEADNLLKYGDKDKAAKIKSASAAIAKKIRGNGAIRTITTFTSQQGFTPNVGVFVSGHPLNMLNQRNNMKASTKVLNIVYNSTVPSEVRGVDVIRNASFFMEAIATLEKQGYRVNLHVCLATHDYKKTSKKTIGVIVKIKDSGKPLDILRMAYPIVNPSFLRRHFLAYCERADWGMPDGYGTPADVREQVKEMNKEAIYVSYNDIDLLAPYEIIDLIRKNANKKK